jgi:hypothetical protein
MHRFVRTRAVASIVLVAALALTGVAGCGRLRDRAAGSTTDTTDMSWDGQALQSLGYDTADLTSAAAVDGTATAAPKARHPRLRFVFQHALHGEATVQTDEGLKTVVAQRGQVTAVDASSVTVKSTDGYTLTWTLGANSVVVVDRARSQIAAVAVGATVGVAGSRDGDTVTVRLLVVPKKS